MRLRTAVVLGYADYNLPSTLQIEASLGGPGAVQAELQGGQECVIAYAGLSPAET